MTPPRGPSRGKRRRNARTSGAKLLATVRTELQSGCVRSHLVSVLRAEVGVAGAVLGAHLRRGEREGVHVEDGDVRSCATVWTSSVPAPERLQRNTAVGVMSKSFHASLREFSSVRAGTTRPAEPHESRGASKSRRACQSAYASDLIRHVVAGQPVAEDAVVLGVLEAPAARILGRGRSRRRGRLWGRGEAHGHRKVSTARLGSISFACHITRTRPVPVVVDTAGPAPALHRGGGMQAVAEIFDTERSSWGVYDIGTRTKESEERHRRLGSEHDAAVTGGVHCIQCAAAVLHLCVRVAFTPRLLHHQDLR